MCQNTEKTASIFTIYEGKDISIYGFSKSLGNEALLLFQIAIVTELIANQSSIVLVVM